MADRMRYDPPSLTRDEATELCVYHLRQAAALFQLIPDDGNKSLLAEIERKCSGDIDDVDKTPAIAWAGWILKAYEEMKDRD